MDVFKQGEYSARTPLELKPSRFAVSRVDREVCLVSQKAKRATAAARLEEAVEETSMNTSARCQSLLFFVVFFNPETYTDVAGWALSWQPG